MFNLLCSLPIFLVAIGIPAALIFALTMKFYREYQNKKYIKDNKEELDRLEKEYNDIVGRNG